MNASTFMAFKYVKSKKYDFLPSLSFLTSFFGVFISVFALIATISIMEGFKQEFEKNILGLRPHIKIYFLNANNKIVVVKDYDQKSELLKNETTFVGGGIAGEAIASDTSGSRLSGIIINGIEAEGFVAREMLKRNLRGKFEDGDTIVIGSELAFLLGVKIGDKITLVSPQFRNTPFGSIPIHKTLKISGIFNVGMYLYDSSFAFLNLKTAESFLQKQGADYLEIITKNPKNLERFKLKIAKIFGDKIRVTDWKTENASFINAINLQKSVMFFILFMFLLLASFIMFSSLSSLVTQKFRTTAILRTIGFTKMQVMLTFLQVGFFATIPAILLGSFLGGIFVLKLEALKNWLEQVLQAKIFDGAHYFLSYIPSHLEVNIILKISTLSLSLCFISIVIPAFRSIKTQPIEALRWE